MLDAQKLTLYMRIDPTALGPDAAGEVEAFKAFAEPLLNDKFDEHIRIVLKVRQSPDEPPCEYFALKKLLNADQADKYLAVFEQELDSIEAAVEEEMSQLMDEFIAARN
ncbi:hypothetical protein [Salinibius halmophilus]|uniref:hypothetical protein n=1 Tax=Salinibius halmophilus TaxID=1853216 RepID=UPI000E6615A7|nr:hypothetical protein [Salinibius halmophilus]